MRTTWVVSYYTSPRQSLLHASRILCSESSQAISDIEHRELFILPLTLDECTPTGAKKNTRLIQRVQMHIKCFSGGLGATCCRTLHRQGGNLLPRTAFLTAARLTNLSFILPKHTLETDHKLSCRSGASAQGCERSQQEYQYGCSSSTGLDGVA